MIRKFIIVQLQSQAFKYQMCMIGFERNPGFPLYDSTGFSLFLNISKPTIFIGKSRDLCRDGSFLLCADKCKVYTALKFKKLFKYLDVQSESSLGGRSEQGTGTSHKHQFSIPLSISQTKNYETEKRLGYALHAKLSYLSDC